MKRTPVLGMLKSYKTADAPEKQMLRDIIGFIEKHPDCFERSLLEGHITASAWIINPTGTHVLLIHHVKLDKWLQPGGHCDGDADVLNVAMKEANEETGLEVKPAYPVIFDIDNHPIPTRKEIPGHMHYDIRFLLTAEMGKDELPGNREVDAIRWIKLEEVHRYNNEDSIMRMVRKLTLLPGSDRRDIAVE